MLRKVKMGKSGNIRGASEVWRKRYNIFGKTGLLRQIFSRKRERGKGGANMHVGQSGEIDDLLERIFEVVVPHELWEIESSGISLMVGNVCAMTLVIFGYLGKGEDLEKLAKITEELGKTGEVEGKLHQLPWDCQDLPEMFDV